MSTRTVATLALLGCFTAMRAEAGRVVEAFDTDWRFHRGDASLEADASAWPRVDVPHDWSIAGPFSEEAPTGGAGGFLPAGVGWYRKGFPTPVGLGNRRVTIEFDGVMANSRVWCNGKLLGERPNGYVSFAYDLTDSLDTRPGAENVIDVRVDNRPQPASRWYTGAGIYRHVRLVTAGPTRIAQHGVFITTPVVGSDEATTQVAVTIDTADETLADIQVRSVLISPSGEQVSEARSTVSSGDASGVLLQHQLAKPRLWGIDSPVLYQAVTQLLVEDRLVDETVTPFGIRSAEFRPESGFWLNGRNTKLKGVCLHHDGGAVGAAVPQRVWERRLERLRALGVNAIRTAHNPVALEFLGLCDRMGFLVMDEFFDCWLVGKNRHDYHLHFERWWRRDLEDTIRRDRNHPSVVLYSVGNEIRDTHRAEQAKRTLRDLVATCHTVDPTRPVTQGLFRPNVTGDYSNGLADMLDVIGTNYRDKELLAAWRDDPTRRIVCTEQSHDRSRWLDCRGAPQHAGQFLWVGIDYLGESRRWPVTTFDTGLIDRTGVLYPRGMQRASWWSERPVLFAVRRVGPNEPTPEDPGYEAVEWVRRRVQFADWTPANLGPHTETVEVYSNCEVVELLLNGQSLGTKSRPRDDAPRVWSVDFSPGELVAVGRNRGELVAESRLQTAGEPAGLRVTSDRPNLCDDWDDVAHVEVEVVDSQGVLVPNADHRLRFSVEGPGTVLAVDNGSIVSLEPFQATTRKAFRGRCLAIVRATDNEGPINLRVESDGLKAAEIAVRP